MELVFIIWVTTACNFNCSYCYEGNNKKALFMSESTADKTVDFIVKKCEEEKIVRCNIVFHGGEPTLNMKAIKSICKSIKEKLACETNFEITTNGYCISESDLDFLIENMSSITISIDGNEEMHNTCRKTVRGLHTYEEVLKIANLINDKVSPRIRMTINSKNYHLLSEGVISLLEFGFNDIIPGIDVFDNDFTDEIFDYIEQEFEVIRDYLIKTKSNAYVAFLNSDEIIRKNVCNGGKSSIHIDCIGDLYPCTYVVGEKDYTIGNVEGGINNSDLDYLLASSSFSIKECEGCDYLKYCMSNRCRFLNEKLTGSSVCPSPVVCAMERLRLRLSMNK